MSTPTVALGLAGVAYAAAFLALRLSAHRSLGPAWQLAVLIFGIELLLYALWSVLLYPRFFSPLRHVPTAPGSSVLMGHTPSTIGRPFGQREREWINATPNEGIIRYFESFNKEALLVTNSQALAEVMTTKSYDFVKPDFIAKNLERVLGAGILVTEGEKHKRQRKHLMPAFAFRHVKDLYPLFWEKTCEMVALVADQFSADKPSDTSSTVITSSDMASRATLDIIGIAGLGKDINALKEPGNKLSRTYQDIFRSERSASVLDIASVFLPLWMIQLLPIEHNNTIGAGVAYIRATCLEVVKEKRAAFEEKGMSSELDILTVALQSGGFTDDELVNQMMTFLAAGHETTSNALNWAIYLLCKHPAIQERLRAELSTSNLPSVFDLDSKISADIIDDLALLNATCNEVLRCIPPVARTARVAIRDTSIVGQFVPKGTHIVLCPEAVNHSTELWGPDADEFNPDRWIDTDESRCNQKGGSKSNYALLTFLHGPRSCIGQGFAKGEFACLLAGFVQAFRFELADPHYVPRLAHGGIQRPTNPFQVRVWKL